MSPISSSHSKLEKLQVSVHIYISKIDRQERKRNVPNSSKIEWKDASSNHVEDEYRLCYHQPL